MSVNKIDLTIEMSEIEEKVTVISRQLRPNWIDMELGIKKFSGGLTNKLVACFPRTKGVDTSETLLFRIYGAATDKYISRDDEITYMNVMKTRGLGPAVYCQFNNGVCYEYLPGMEVTQSNVIEKPLFTRIAQVTACMHTIGIEDTSRVSVIFQKIYSILSLVRDDYQAEEVVPRKEQLQKEVEFLEHFIGDYTQKHGSRVVNSHNDLLLANIIYDPKKDSVKFIDYEYGGPNYQAYDVANHFNEFAGVDPVDYSMYPSKEFQLEWIKEYMKEFQKQMTLCGKQLPNDYLDDTHIEQFYCEVSKFTLVSNLLWGIWAILQHQVNSGIGFDFMVFARARLGEYFKHKNERLQL